MPILFDRQTYTIAGSSRRERTPDGYLRVPGFAARTGIQQYLARELDLTDRNPTELVNVYRPDDEVFKPDSLASYNAMDATNDHPTELVNADTYKAVTVGTVASEGRQVGDFVEVDLLIKDAQAIADVEAGKVQLSAGYEADFVPERGTTTDGQPYEFVQRNIRINHVALVKRARAGAQARLHDNSPTIGGNMPRVILDDGTGVEVADDATATLISSRITALQAKVSDAESKAEKAEMNMEKTKAEKDEIEEKLEEAKKASSDAAIAERVKAVSSTLESARRVAGDSFECDSMSLSAIQRAALMVKRTAIDWADKSDVYVQAAFDVALESADAAPDSTVKAQHAQVARDAAPKPDDKEPENPRKKYADSIESAWKGGAE